MNLFKSVILDRFQSFRKSWPDIIGGFWRKFKSSFSFSSSNNFSAIDCFIDRAKCLFLTCLLKKKFYRARIWSFFCLVRRNKNRMARRKSTRWKFNLSHALKITIFSKIERNFGNLGRVDLQVVEIVDQYWDCDLCWMKIDVLLNQSEERISYYRIELNRHTDFLLSEQFDIPKNSGFIRSDEV